MINTTNLKTDVGNIEEFLNYYKDYINKISNLSSSNSRDGIQKLAESGDILAQNCMGYFYDLNSVIIGKGDVIEKNRDTALKWYYKASAQRSKFADVRIEVILQPKRKNILKLADRIRGLKPEDFNIEHHYNTHSKPICLASHAYFMATGEMPDFTGLEDSDLLERQRMVSDIADEYCGVYFPQSLRFFSSGDMGRTKYLAPEKMAKILEYFVFYDVLEWNVKLHEKDFHEGYKKHEENSLYVMNYKEYKEFYLSQKIKTKYDTYKLDRLVRFDSFMKKALQGDAKEQCRVGEMYQSGNKKDYRLSYKWIRRSAKQNYGEGLYQYAIMLLEGIDMDKQPKLAYKYLEKAAEQGFISTDWIRKASKGSSKLQYYLGLSWENAKDEPKNISRAVLWYKYAADQGLVEAQDKLKELNV